MAKRKTAKRKTSKRRLLRRSKTQTGKTNLKVDRKRKALAPGKRRSATGKTYTETRRNRSDKNRRKKL
jgi:hypothetical protein